MRAFIKFNKGVMKMPMHWQVWLMLLVLANMIVPLFFLGRREAQVVIGVFVASAVMQVVLTSVTGFTRLLGLGHILWFPLLYFLWMRLEQNPADDFFGLWIRMVMMLNALSLVIDVVDVVRYIAGDRSETVEALVETH
ncbi:MAG: hypothetical protein O6950_02645 [Gammaproteobacteria bacterium]|nr:hypothetical protein [Gammaproteobacteria bacterium]